MTFKLSTVDQLTQNNGVKFLVYSKPKIGKTTLIKTAPNPLVISAERGLLSLRNDPASRNIAAIEITTLTEFDEVHEWCIKSAEAKKYDTFCLDSITELAEVCLLEEKAKTLANTPKGKKVNNFEPYMELKDHILSVFRSFRDFSHRHVYFIAQQILDKEEDTGMVMNKPAMPGSKLENAIPYIFDEIFQLVRFTSPEGVPYNALRTCADSLNVAGDRSSRLDQWEPANLTHIINKIMNAGSN